MRLRPRGGWTGRFLIALAVAVAVATAGSVLTWRVTSPRTAQAVDLSAPVVLEHWTLDHHELLLAEELPPFEAGDEPFRASPGALVAVLGFDITYTDPALLYDTGCTVTFRTRDGQTEWRPSNLANYDAYGQDSRSSCQMSPATEDEPAEIELGETVRIVHTTEVPADVADQLVAEVRVFDYTEAGTSLREHAGEVAAYLVE